MKIVTQTSKGIVSERKVGGDVVLNTSQNEKWDVMYC